MTVSGETVDTGLGGGAGWLALGSFSNGSVVPVSADDVSCDLVVQGDGMMLIFK